MGVLTELLKLGMKTAVKQADEVVPRAVSKVDDQLLDMKYTRETPKKKGAFSSIGLAAEGKITDQEAIGGLFNPYTFKNNKMIIGPDASNLNTSRIEISTFPPPGEKIPGFGMKTADDVGLPASEVGNRIDDDAIEVQTNLIEGSKWKWEGELNEGFEKFKDNTYLVSMKGGSKLKKASGGPTGHSYTTKVIYEKGGNLSTYDTRAEYVKELHKSIPESLAALKIKIPKEVEKLTKELKAKGKSAEEIKKEVDALKKKLTRDYKGDNPKGKPTTIGIPEFGTKIGDIKKGGIIQPVYDQIIMREEGGQVLPVIEKNIGGQVLEGLDGEYMRQRNSKEKLDGIMGIPQIQPRQYGGGLDDAYMNRRSAFAPPDVNSAFASPMSQGGLPTIYRQEGGNFSVQGGIKNYMNNNTGQIVDNVPEKWKSSPSHPETLLSYITKDEANLLKRANIHNSPKSKPPGSGVGPSGIPSFNGYGVGDDDYGNYSGATGGTEGDANYTDYQQEMEQEDRDTGSASLAENAPDYVTVGKDEMQQAEDDQMYRQYADAYSNQMSVDPKDPSGYLDSYAKDFGRTGFLGLFGPTRTRNEALNNNEAALRDAYVEAYGEERGNLIFNQQLAAPGGYNNVSYSFGRPGNFEETFNKGLAESVANSTETNDKNDAKIDKENTENIERIAELHGLEYKAADKDEKSEDSKGVSIAKQVGKFGIGLASPALGAAMGLYGLLNNDNKVGTFTDPKTGMSFSLNKDGTVTNDDPVSSQLNDNIDYGNDAPEKKRRPIQQKTVSTAEDKPLTGMAALYANKNKPVSRKASNKYLEDLLASIYPNPTNRPTLG